MKKQHLTVEQVIQQKAEREELRRLRNLKINLEKGVVFDVSPELMNMLLTKHWRDL